MASIYSSREARRRKIMDRGSDRLAFITGQVQSVPPPIAAYSPQPSDSPDEYRHPLLSKQSDDVSPPEDVASAAVLPKQDITPQHEISNNDDSYIEQLTRNETSSRPEISSVVERPPNPHGNLSKPFSPTQVTSAIASSERVRLLCSAAAGLLVVLWNVGFPFIGSSNAFSSVVMMKPVYLVFLTNVTIVVSLLIFGKNMRSAPRAENSTNTASGYDWVSQIGTSLEMGLMIMNVMDAVVMDFSLYAVVVVCGILLGQVFF